MSEEIEPVACGKCDTKPEMFPIYASTGKPDAWLFVCACRRKFLDEFPHCIGRNGNYGCRTVCTELLDGATQTDDKSQEILVTYGSTERYNYLHVKKGAGLALAKNNAPILIPPNTPAYTKNKAVKRWNHYQTSFINAGKPADYFYLDYRMRGKTKRAAIPNVTCRYCGTPGFTLMKHNLGRALGSQRSPHWGLFTYVDMLDENGKVIAKSWKQHKCKHYIKLYIKEGYDEPIS
jgi:hypothetical protein